MNLPPIRLDTCRALVIDPNPTSRSILTAQLRDFGVGAVSQCGRVQDARRTLESKVFDIVLCEMDFDAVGRSAQSGHQLLEELRRENLLPLSTVFIMVTGERTYAKVAEAAESALDSYLLKPFTATSLLERVTQSRHRKQELMEIYEAVEDGDFDEAARLCLERFKARTRYWLYAARLGAELLLRLNRHAEAKELLDAVLETQALPWARLGIARTQLAMQQNAPAMRTLEADAYDVMGRAQMSQGNLNEALETYRKAADLTPGAVRRQQALGMLAFYTGDLETAAAALERAMLAGQGSRTFDFQSLVLLAFTRFHQRDAKALRRCLTDLQAALEKAPDSIRLQRFVRVVGVFDEMLAKQVSKVVAELKVMALEIQRPDFDLEAGCNLMSALAQLTAAELKLPNAEDWVMGIARRFCGTRSISELMARTAGSHPPFADLVQRCHIQVNQAAEKAMMHSISGDPGAAIEALFRYGANTMNHRFLDTAKGLLDRYGSRLENAAARRDELQALRERLGPQLSTPPAFGQASEMGGIKLRAQQRTEADAPTPA